MIPYSSHICVCVSVYTECPKKIERFFFRCPVCGECCKLHWLLLDTPSFDWNTRRSRGHKSFKMAPTEQQNFWKKYNHFRTSCTYVGYDWFISLMLYVATYVYKYNIILNRVRQHNYFITKGTYIGYMFRLQISHLQAYFCHLRHTLGSNRV